MTNWYNFYKNRINSSYQEYFEKRYDVMLQFIACEKSEEIIEMGCGIGSISKALNRIGIKSTGFDVDINMVNLANINNNTDVFYEGCIHSFKNDNILAVSHGVLEHFEDEQILNICKNNPNSIHYVPLDKYKVPSFGDERLLSYKYWLDLVKPKDYVLFNDYHDLIFKI